MANNERKFRYSCVRCKQEKYDRLDYHFTHCKGAIEGVDYVTCKLCGHRGATLYGHVKKHNLTKEEYQEKYGNVCSEISMINISMRNSITQQKSNYRNRLKREGRLEELERLNKKTSVSVSRAIMGNDQERDRRSKLLGKLNKRKDFRERSSLAAIKTSARKDIQIKRSEQLRIWRNNNREEFYEKCTKQMHKLQSQPEEELYKVVSSFDSSFKRNQLLKRTKVFSGVNKSGIKQIDIFSKKKKIVIEFDGELHFFNVKKWNQLDKVRKKDSLLNTLNKEFCIIRISYDQYSYRKVGGGFSQKCLDKLKEVLDNPTPGLYCVGEAYGENNIL